LSHYTLVTLRGVRLASYNVSRGDFGDRCCAKMGSFALEIETNLRRSAGEFKRFNGHF
jgi:hypothetical protein